MTAELRAYAKLNLTLEVTGKRDDGYHTLDTIMQSVSLHDDIVITKEGSNSFITTIGAPCDGSNLCVRARDAFFAYTEIVASPDISLLKRIPTGAGLGGGSADAAAVLRGLDRLYCTNLGTAALQKLGSTLGADIPFCIEGGTCHCLGIGDEVIPLTPARAFDVVIAKGKAALSTAEMYALFDSNPSHGCRDEMESALASGSLSAVARSLHNCFTGVCSSVCPDISILLSKLSRLGAAGCSMTGSGSAVFGLFADEYSAAAAAKLLLQQGYFAYSCRFVSPR